MRYMLMMEDGKMKATVYPEPYCWEATPKGAKGVGAVSAYEGGH
ncbi:MAG: hypothetical protein ACLTSZ_08470 [Lachnospiraceae bacterium]